MLSGISYVIIGSLPPFFINADIGVVLIILEQDIVIGLVQLNQVAFQNQRFQIGAAEHDIEIVDMRNHGRDLGRVVVAMEIAPHPVF